MGSPYYMSPQILFNEPYWFKTDIYSIGIVAYQLLFSRYPFPANSLEELQSLTRKAKFDLKHGGRKISKQMCKILKSMLSYEEKDRISAEQLIQL